MQLAALISCRLPCRRGSSCPMFGVTVRERDPARQCERGNNCQDCSFHVRESLVSVCGGASPLALCLLAQGAQRRHEGIPDPGGPPRSPPGSSDSSPPFPSIAPASVHGDDESSAPASSCPRRSRRPLCPRRACPSTECRP